MAERPVRGGARAGTARVAGDAGRKSGAGVTRTKWRTCPVTAAGRTQRHKRSNEYRKSGTLFKCTSRWYDVHPSAPNIPTVTEHPLLVMLRPTSGAGPGRPVSAPHRMRWMHRAQQPAVPRAADLSTENRDSDSDAPGRGPCPPGQVSGATEARPGLSNSDDSDVLRSRPGPAWSGPWAGRPPRTERLGCFGDN